MEADEQNILMPLPEAALFLFGTKKRVSTLRTAIRKGELVPKRIAGTFFVSKQDLKDMNIRCREDRKAHISTQEKQPMLSETGKKKSPRDAALMKLSKLTFGSQNTLQPSGSPKSGATVVHLAKRSS